MRRKSFDATPKCGRPVVDRGPGGRRRPVVVGVQLCQQHRHQPAVGPEDHLPGRHRFAQAKPGTEVTPGMIPYLAKYAGQQLTTGAQAEAYANHFIAVHLQEIGGGKTYSS